MQYLIIGIVALVLIATISGVAYYNIQQTKKEAEAEIEQAKKDAEAEKTIILDRVKAAELIAEQAKAPVDGGWSVWANTNPKFNCKNCSDSYKQVRKCNNPYPANGGKDCEGKTDRMMYCDKKCQFKKINEVQLDYYKDDDFVVADGLRFPKPPATQTKRFAKPSTKKKDSDKLKDYQDWCEKEAGCEILVVPDNYDTAWYYKYDKAAMLSASKDMKSTSYIKRKLLDSRYK